MSVRPAGKRRESRSWLFQRLRRQCRHNPASGAVHPQKGRIDKPLVSRILDKTVDRFAQIIESAVKEMFDAGHDK